MQISYELEDVLDHALGLTPRGSRPSLQAVLLILLDRPSIEEVLEVHHVDAIPVSDILKQEVVKASAMSEREFDKLINEAQFNSRKLNKWQVDVNDFFMAALNLGSNAAIKQIVDKGLDHEEAFDYFLYQKEA